MKCVRLYWAPVVPASQSASFATLAPAPFASHSFETSRRLPRLPLPLSKCRSPPGDPRACPCCCCCRVDLSPFFASFRYSHLGSFQKSRLETVVEPDQTPSSVGYSSDSSPPHSPGASPSPPHSHAVMLFIRRKSSREAREARERRCAASHQLGQQCQIVSAEVVSKEADGPPLGS